MHLRHASLTALALAACCTGHASAQTSAGSANGAPSAQPSAPSSALTEVVVTATRRPVELEKVPAAVTVFNATAIEKIGGTNIGTVLNLVPGVNFTGEDTYRTTLTIRGVSGSNEDAAVAMYLDGVYIGHDLGQNLTNLDPESVQILRGPQGALYGKNTLGGAVVINSRQPSFDPHLSLLTGFGEYNAYNEKISATGPITDNLAAYGYVFANGHDGEYHNIYSDKNVGIGHEEGGQVAILYNATENVAITLRADYSRDQYQEANRKGLVTTASFLPNQFSAGYNDDVALNYIGNGATNNYGTVLNVTATLPAFTLTSITGYRGYEVTDSRDVDGTGRANGEANIYQRENQVSQEFTFTSRGHERFNWIGGVQLYHDDLNEIFSVVDTVGSVIYPGLGTRTPVTYVYHTHNYDTNSSAIYGQGDYRIISGLTLAGGLRYALDGRSYYKTEAQYLSNPAQTGFFYEYPESATYSAFIPEVSLTYEFDPHVSLYGKYGRSYRPGGFNVNSTLNPSAQNNFNKETADSYEMGIRTRFFSNRITFNATAFDIQWQNQQVSFINQIGAFTIDNVQSSSKGIEVESSAKITPELQLSVSGTYLDAVFGDAILPTRNPVTRVAFFAQAEGTPLNFAPKWSAAATATYTHSLGGDRKIFFRTDVSYKGAQSVQPLRPDLASPAITRVDSRLEYDWGRYSAALWVKNALDQFSNYTSQSTATIDVIGLTEPRTFGAELAYKF
jgi:iron complex outermembrane recepter protein